MDPQRVLSSQTSPRQATVLVVDDDEATCRLLGEWVRLLGFKVMTACSADLGLSMMRENPADVAMCDIVMPGHDGYWLIDQLRRHFPDTAIIVATGLTKMDPALTLAPPVTGYLVKPFDFDDVASAVGNAVAAAAATDCRH